MGPHVCACTKSGSAIRTSVGGIVYQGQKSVKVGKRLVGGHVVSVGNPHFIVFEKTTQEWLATNGKQIESNELFPQRTNVEFVWWASVGKAIECLVYERGCGMTLACSSGAAAITGLLCNLGALQPLQKLAVRMCGGELVTWIDGDGRIVLQGEACPVFKGETTLS
jgi:diaminopimelate epimerase